MTDDITEAVDKVPLPDEPEAGPTEEPTPDGEPETLETEQTESLTDRLLNDDPHKPLSEYGRELWDPETGGIARVLRGMEKAGLPVQSAIADIVLGIAEEMHDIDLDTDNGEDTADSTDLDIDPAQFE